jgi:taurine dioxygenase
MTQQVRPLGGRFGARLEGIDFDQPIGEAEIDAIADALHAHQVLSLPAATMRPEQHLQIALRFGVPEEQATDQFGRHETVPHITVIDSAKGDRADSWHADETFLEHPPLVNLLHAKQIPEVGGDTAFVSAACAYEALSEKFKTLLDGLTAVHDYGHLYELGWRAGLPLGPAVGAALSKGLIHSHPVVKIHPKTGRRWLNVNPTYTRFIEGVEPLEAQSLLDFLLRHMQKPEFAFRHHWREGDLLIWDQQAVQHYAVNDFEGRRLMHRISALETAETYTGIKA